MVITGGELREQMVDTRTWLSTARTISDTFLIRNDNDKKILKSAVDIKTAASKRPLLFASLACVTEVRLHKWRLPICFPFAIRRRQTPAGGHETKKVTEMRLHLLVMKLSFGAICPCQMAVPVFVRRSKNTFFSRPGRDSNVASHESTTRHRHKTCQWQLV